MDRVFSQQQRPISDVGHAAIAVRSVNPSQQHIGVLHREDGVDEVHLLHLAWHHDLRNHAPGAAYFWVDPNVPSRRMRQVAAICRKVWRSNQGTLPYALSPPSDCFDQQTGEFLLGPTQHGLTCASFVLALFETAGLRLAHYETWPTDRPGDREWQEWVIGQLESGAQPANSEHIEAVKGEVGTVRCRPEDVAGAATVSPLPADFATAEKRAAGILDRLRGG
ncbi:MAG: hypothetical protein IID46_11840 [Planctomycetes bacterium]|nr:hypothetical protein [Planctomycetota bacterium]